MRPSIGGLLRNTVSGHGGKAFVDTFGRLVLLVAGSVAMITLLQTTVISMGAIPLVIDERPISALGYAGMADVILCVARNLPAIFGASFLISIAGVIGALGLLKRRDWGRRVLIVLLGTGLAWSIVATLVLPFVIGWLLKMSGPQPTMLVVGMGAVAIATGSIGAVVCWWLLRRLQSEEVRLECLNRSRQGPVRKGG